MSLVYVPLAEFGRFILIKAVVNAHGNLTVLQRVGEVEIGGRIVSRVAAKKYEQNHLACTHVGGKVFDRLGLVDRISIDRVAIEHSLADVTKTTIDSLCEGMHHRRLMVTDDHDARTCVRLKVFRNSICEILTPRPQLRMKAALAGPRHLAHKSVDLG